MTKLAQTSLGVLVVEDYEPNAVVTTSFLDELGYGHDVAPDGERALEKFSVGRYALVLMDIQMPGIDGMETARRMRAHEKEKKIAPTPIVAVTARATEDDRILCLKAGMNDCLSKPFLLDDLAAKLRLFLPQPATGS
jgi:CheY-like chemotaxis protein